MATVAMQLQDTREACAACGKVLPLGRFGVNQAASDGLQYFCRPCVSEQSRRSRASNPNVPLNARRAQLKLMYNLTLEQYDEILDAQGGVCACCGTSEPGGHGRFHVDHDHRCCSDRRTCGQCIRGLTCSSCNIGIGSLGDSVEGVMNALVYLLERE